MDDKIKTKTLPFPSEWHTNALKGVIGPTHDGEVELGWYRSRQRDGEFLPVIYWQDTKTGEIRCQINGRNVDDLRMQETFNYCKKNPITEDAYWYRVEKGSWADNDVTVIEAAKGTSIDPAVDPVGAKKQEIELALSGVAKYKGIDSDEMASKAQTLRSQLTTLSGSVVKLHKAKKEPHLEAGRAIDREWFPLRDMADDGAKTIRKELDEWETTKLRAKRAEEARQAEVEREQAARDLAALEAGKPIEQLRQIPTGSPPPSNTPAPSEQIKGASGRTASVSKYNHVIAIDAEKVFQQFKTNPDVITLLTALAQKAINAGVTIEGATTEERAKVR